MKKIIFGICLLIMFIICTPLSWLYNMVGNMNSFHNSCFEQLKITNFDSYYLNDKGELFCPVYNRDAGAYAPINSKKIVGRNVKSFDINHFINNNNELYIWGTNYSYSYVPGFDNEKRLNLIANNVLEANINLTNTSYINTKNELWTVGNVYDIQYNEFTKIAENVSQIVYINDELAYIDVENRLWQNGQILFENMRLKDVVQVDEQVVLLTTSNELYFYGTLTDEWINQHSDNKKTMLNIQQDNIIKLKDNIKKVSMDSNIIAALDNQGEVYIWGYFYSNGDDKNTQKEVEPYYEYKLASNVKDVSVTTWLIGMIDENGKTFAYGENDYFSGIGNSISSEKEYIGLNASEPIRWTKENKYFK